MKIEHDSASRHRGETMTGGVVIHSLSDGSWRPGFTLHSFGTRLEFDEVETRDAIRLLTEQLRQYESGETQQRVLGWQRGDFSGLS